MPVAAIVAVVPFSDELYNEQRTRAACAAEGGLQVDRVVRARFAESAAASIETRRVDREEGAYWRHELIYVYKPTGEELGRLRWFRRKYGWLQGNVPGTAHAHYFKAEDCPDPQRYLAGGRSRMELVRQLEGD